MTEKLKTMKIHGKDYVTVNSRIEYFRQKYANGRIHTEITNLSEGKVIFKASAYLGDTCVATGHAMEKESSSQINKTSYIENCETSAIGRCLGILGIGIEGSVATYEEVNNAISQQEDKQHQAAPDADESNMQLVENQRYDPGSWTVPFKKAASYGLRLDEMTDDQIIHMHKWMVANNADGHKMIGEYIEVNGMVSLDDEEIPMEWNND